MAPALRYECRCRRRPADPHEVSCLKWDSVRGENVKTVVYNLCASVSYRNHIKEARNVLENPQVDVHTLIMENIPTFQEPNENFVTVVSVGSELSPKCELFPTAPDPKSSGYVTVLTIGDSESECVSKDITEEVLVYRLPGERLGFGLKFEGGTKANEFVKKLFIQSCAPDSPASRVQSSWGKLTEGDEVLEIDCMPVNTMTRIDCVRCLKDSNVVIKLLVRHFGKNEDLPQVISAEKKRTPPPPPPVPPRKIPKKFYKNNHQTNGHENPVPAARQIHQMNSEVSNNSSSKKKFQSPRSSGRASQSPDIPRRDRRFSDGSLGPPDAEVYVDLFSQESTQSLSESDDTGSSISTVVDRFGSFPTTAPSSLAGSLPSTPTSVQKQIDFTNIFNAYEDEDFQAHLNKNSIKQNVNGFKILDDKDKNEEKPFTLTNGEDGTPLQPPSCFQDAPLSYGNENMRIIETKSNGINMCELIQEKNFDGEKNLVRNIIEDKVFKKPPVPPRSKDLINRTTECKEFQNVHDENMNIPNLPRLVDFVPKSALREDLDHPVEIINSFLENERRETDYLKNEYYADDEIDTHVEVYNNDIDIYNSKWSLSSQLATIGEVEEEGAQDLSANRSPVNTPIVIVDEPPEETNTTSVSGNLTKNEGINGKMETLPSDPRQPPDGHEFPDYVEANNEANEAKHYQDLLDDHLKEKNVEPTESVNWKQNSSSFNDLSKVPMQNMSSLSKVTSVSNSDLSSINTFVGEEVALRRNSLEPTFHARSQSLTDVSSISKQKNDRWKLLIEQRKKSFSKLKGLVIPEYVENESVPSINIPEIISHTISPYIMETKSDPNEIMRYSSETEPVALPLPSPPWTSNTSTFPKYSPAFKRKNLQVYSQKYVKPEEVLSAINKPPVKSELEINSATLKNKSDDELRLDNLSDSPKSLESITSPTRSDCSFDYVTKVKKEPHRVLNHVSKLHKDVGKSEDESDNDSAVSSSQSSYISRCSPPPSPTRSCEMLDYDSNSRPKSDILPETDKYNQCRLLKAASVEAINRKNILASAKCRSGRDLKVGSPVIQRKYEDDPPKTKSSANQQAKEENCQPSAPCSLLKEKQSLSRAESRSKPVLNGDNSVENTVKSEIRHPSVLTSTERNDSKLLRSNSTQLNEIKITPKNNIPRPTSLTKNNKSLSVTDLRKSFEKFGVAPPPLPQSVSFVGKEKPRNSKTGTKIGKAESPNEKKSKTEVAKLETVKLAVNLPQKITVEKEEQASATREIILCPEFVGGSLGITLAGGTDYETKEITVHKIRYRSVAYNDGQLKKGDRILSVNDKSTANLTHAESVELLKEPVSKFVLIVEDGREENLPSPKGRSSSCDTSELKSPTSPVKAATHVITLTKNGAGLGFSIEGGKDSLEGDLPLRVKKIFQGGIAEKNGELCVGDELLAINDTSLINMSRIETWSLMKKLPDGNVNIHIHR